MKNTVTAAVVGSSVQAGAVHGDVHVHHHTAVAMAQSAIDSVKELQAALGSTTGGFRREALERLLADLEVVHRDYLMMFESVLEQVPDAWEQGTPHFTESVEAAAALLRRLRLEYEPVRVRVHAVAETFSCAVPTAPEDAYVAAVLAYFPTGELRVDEGTYRLRTSGTAVLDHLYRSLDGELGQELGTFVKNTLAFHRQRWSEVCRTYAALQLSWDSGK